MSEDQERKITPSSGGGVFGDLALRIKLIMRLMGDKRVNLLLKLLPVGSLLYLLIPDIAPGPLDDAAIIWLGTYLFVELCPPDIVQEHVEALTRVVPGSWHDSPEESPQVDEEDIIDAEYRMEE
jgi:hypothetical protein